MLEYGGTCFLLVFYIARYFRLVISRCASVARQNPCIIQQLITCLTGLTVCASVVTTYWQVACAYVNFKLLQRLIPVLSRSILNI